MDLEFYQIKYIFK